MNISSTLIHSENHFTHVSKLTVIHIFFSFLTDFPEMSITSSLLSTGTLITSWSIFEDICQNKKPKCAHHNPLNGWLDGVTETLSISWCRRSFESHSSDWILLSRTVYRIKPLLLNANFMFWNTRLWQWSHNGITMTSALKEMPFKCLTEYLETAILSSDHYPFMGNWPFCWSLRIQLRP